MTCPTCESLSKQRAMMIKVIRGMIGKSMTISAVHVYKMFGRQIEDLFIAPQECGIFAEDWFL